MNAHGTTHPGGPRVFTTTQVQTKQYIPSRSSKPLLVNAGVKPRLGLQREPIPQDKIDNGNRLIDLARNHQTEFIDLASGIRCDLHQVPVRFRYVGSEILQQTPHRDRADVSELSQGQSVLDINKQMNLGIAYVVGESCDVQDCVDLHA